VVVLRVLRGRSDDGGRCAEVREAIEWLRATVGADGGDVAVDISLYTA
jgi:hypothetical protein